MAKRLVYVPNLHGNVLVAPFEIEFTWAPGLATSQKQKNIRALHEAAGKRNLPKVLEISTKSENATGVALSAFNLQLVLHSGVKGSVESIFQASKVFEHGGPYLDLLSKGSRAAKTDERLKSSGQLIGFQLEGDDWPLQPTTVFYDWLYLKALVQNPELANELSNFDGFTDIEFNPQRSLNCQAASAALYVALLKRDEPVIGLLRTRDRFVNRIVRANRKES